MGFQTVTYHDSNDDVHPLAVLAEKLFVGLDLYCLVELDLLLHL
jgi:hypothetical protein